VIGRVLHAAWSEDLARAEAETAEVDQQLAQRRENARRLKAIDEVEAPVWLDELYELNARIPDVNTLQVTSINAEAAPKAGNSKPVAKYTLKGKLLSRSNPRKPLNELVAKLREEPYYSVAAPVVEPDDTFTLVVSVERRPPEEYKVMLKDEQLKAAPRSRSRPAARPKEESAEDAEGGGEEEKANPDAQERPSKGQGRGKGRSKRPG